MRTYRYRAIDDKGKRIRGREKAETANVVFTNLLDRELHPVEVKEHKSVLKFEITRKKVPRKELMHFSRQLAVFMRAGIPVLEAIEIIEEGVTNKLLKNALVSLAESLRAGQTFAEATAE